MSSKPVPRALIQTQLQILSDIFVEDFYSDKVIERTFKLNKQLGARDRKFLAETTYDLVRWTGFLDALCKKIFLVEASFQNYLFFYLILFKDNPEFSLLQSGNDGHLRVEGILKKIVNVPLADRNFAFWTEKGLTDIEILSFPEWIYDELRFGSNRDLNAGSSLDLLKALNEKAPVVLRTNTLKITREKLKAELEKENVFTSLGKLAPTALHLRERANVFQTQAFKNGFFEMQDEGSQMISPLLDIEPGMKVCDACAGAGAKTLHISALLENRGTLLALDVHEKKLEQLKLRARRAGASNVRLQVIDSSKIIKRQIDAFDRLLLDVPCTGTGVIRRNPDTKWKLSVEELEKLLLLQTEILGNYSKMVRVGGKMVYATCSLFEKENEKQVEKFLARQPGWAIDSDYMNLSPVNGPTDGFFAVRLKRNS